MVVIDGQAVAGGSWVGGRGGARGGGVEGRAGAWDLGAEALTAGQAGHSTQVDPARQEVGQRPRFGLTGERLTLYQPLRSHGVRGLHEALAEATLQDGRWNERGGQR